MKPQKWVGFLLAGVAVGGVPAQQNSMPDMPGMSMGTTTKLKQQTSQRQPFRPEPNRTPESTDPLPSDLHSMGQDAGNKRAKAASSSEQNSVEQQASRAHKQPADGRDVISLTFPTQDVQEPEATGFRTGGDLPAPELLEQVVGREPMQVEDFLSYAEQHHPSLTQAQRNIDRSLQQARQVSLPPDPTIGYSGDHIRGGQYHGGEQGVFFSQVFVLGHKLALRRNIYRAEGQSNRFALEAQQARVRDDIASGFIDALAAQQSVELHDRLLKVALDNEMNTHELQRVGQADASAVLMAEVAAEQSKIDFSNAQRTFLSAFAQLATNSGYPSLPVHPLKGGLVEPPRLDAEFMVTSDLQESPLIKQAQSGVDVAQARLNNAHRESVPNLSVTAGEWNSGEQLEGIRAKAGWESFAQASVQVPLWNRNQGNVEAAKAILDRANREVERARLWTRNRAEPYAQEYERARFTADRYRTEIIPRARRAYDLEVLQYQQMAQVYPAVLTAQRMLFTLQLSYVEALRSEWKAALALQNYTLMDGLEQPSSTGTDAVSLNLPTDSGGSSNSQ